MEPKRIKHLVVDSGAFIKNSPVHEYAENIYTVNGAVKEIKDRATRERLQFLPYKLVVKEPSSDAYKHVLDFSKKTGDFSNLSLVDLNIIALTYQLEKENVGTDHLNQEPSCEVTTKPTKIDTALSGFYYPKECQLPISFLTEDSDPDDDDDGSDWITPNNIAEIRKKMGSLGLEQASSVVACVTTDFSVQNVLLQIGLNVVAVDGLLIRKPKVFILRCYACYKSTNDITKKFCPHCGNKTLKKVAVTYNDDGTKNIHINFRRPINVRGKRFSLPTPKGGRHAQNPIVVEDQPVTQNRLCKAALLKTNAWCDNYEVLDSPFARNDVSSRGVNLGLHVRSQLKKKSK